MVLGGAAVALWSAPDVSAAAHRMPDPTTDCRAGSAAGCFRTQPAGFLSWLMCHSHHIHHMRGQVERILAALRSFRACAPTQQPGIAPTCSVALADDTSLNEFA